MPKDEIVISTLPDSPTLTNPVVLTDEAVPGITITIPQPRFIRVADGHAGGMVPVAKHGSAQLIGFMLIPGETYPIVPDDSGEEGCSESLATSLVERGLCCYVVSL